MDINGVVQAITAYVQDNIIVTVIVGLFVLFLLLRHPKILLLILGFGALAHGIAWLFDRLARAGL